MNFKNIHIGNLIQQKVKEDQIEMLRICNFMKRSEEEILNMFTLENLSSEILLRWSKLLKYDLFRLYSQHLILYSPAANMPSKNEESHLPVFRKRIYAKEIIDFILELINTEEKTKQQVIEEYNIPKTTLYKWIAKQEQVNSKY
ncbi:transposase [Chryseobacterium carnipullorum]|uniref:Transposase n=1 Tax=Chryseobacterium carnipullorum TaxID=1124835 RepID=A0A3G6ME59_CHRCU|nr:transposase [Chryseobacterium carnipullorum]AZA67817.1 transposase [Chryseobacterium carnipullorum]HBV16053.1 transposase [Chryseobacterium carnipullorum]